MIRGGVSLLAAFWTVARILAQPAAPRFPEFAPPADVALPPANASRYPSGLALLEVSPGTGVEHPAGDDCVELSFTSWKRDGTLLATSGKGEQAATQCLSKAIPGVAEALERMVAGERARIWIPAGLAIRAADDAPARPGRRKAAPPAEPITVDLRLFRVIKAPPVPLDLHAAPDSAVRLPSGVAMLVLRPGAGKVHPTASSTVRLQYSGWRAADGELFETTEMSGHPGVFLLGTTLPGWREALQRMVAGEKIRLWVPGAMAYGDHPTNRKVPAGDLVYDIELLDVR